MAETETKRSISAAELNALLGSRLSNLATEAGALSPTQAAELAERLVFIATTIIQSSDHCRREVFARCERFGAHLTPVHFYSPVPSQSDLASHNECRYENIPGLFPTQATRGRVLESYETFARELSDIPAEPPGEPGFYWANPALCEIDALGLYSTVRSLRPRRVIEVGSGYSTLLIARALERNGFGELVSIDPNESALARSATRGEVRMKVVRERVQDVPTQWFRELSGGDLIFYDGSHVSKYASDVNHMFFNVLPALAPRVVVHVHDIFLPNDYPKPWLQDKKIFWNEQYLLTAFMSFNSEFEPLIAHGALASLEPDALRRLSSLTGAAIRQGSSYWFRRRPENS